MGKSPAMAKMPFPGAVKQDYEELVALSVGFDLYEMSREH